MVDTERGLAAAEAATWRPLTSQEQEDLRDLLRFREDIRAMAEGRRALLWIGYVARYVAVIAAGVWAYVEWKK